MFAIIMGLLGGLALFIYGMQCMGDGLQKLTGDKMKKILGVLTSTPVVGVLVGTAVTAIVQSSSLTTVLAVGFVNASLMTLKQAVALIMGANIGTTVTAQLVAFEITKYWAAILAGGFVIFFFFRRKTLKNTGFIFFSLGLLLLGMVTMSEAMYPLRESAGFRGAILFFSEYKILGLLAGMVFTAVVQSSSAAVGLLIAMAGSGLLPLEAALPVLLGSNIGTCITAVLAAVGASLSARRVAAAHILFNLLGAVVFMLLLPIFHDIVLLITPSGSIAREIANAHTIFNVLSTLLVLPFINPFTKLAAKLVPGEEPEKVQGVQYLDWHLIHSPGLAVDLARQELRHMADIAADNVRLAMDALLERDAKRIARVREQEEVVDELEKEISRYLAKVSQYAMSEKLSVDHTGLLHVANDIERISDHADNIADLTEGMLERGLKCSDEALHGLRGMKELALDTFQHAVRALDKHDMPLARGVHGDEQKIDDMERSLRKAHMKRLINGDCSPETGVLFLDVISNLERVGDHANNIANIAEGKI